MRKFHHTCIVSVLCLLMCVIPAFAQDDEEEDGGGDDGSGAVYECTNLEPLCLLLAKDSENSLKEDEGQEIPGLEEEITEYLAAVQKNKGFYNIPNLLKLIDKKDKELISLLKELDGVNFNTVDTQELPLDQYVELEPDSLPSLMDIEKAAAGLKKNSLTKKNLQAVHKFLQGVSPDAFLDSPEITTSDDIDDLESLRTKALRQVRKLLGIK